MRSELIDPPAFSSPLSSSLSELLEVSSALAGLSLCRMLALSGHLSTPAVRVVRVDSTRRPPLGTAHHPSRYQNRRRS